MGRPLRKRRAFYKRRKAFLIALIAIQILLIFGMSYELYITITHSVYAGHHAFIEAMLLGIAFFCIEEVKNGLGAWRYKR